MHIALTFVGVLGPVYSLVLLFKGRVKVAVQTIAISVAVSMIAHAIWGTANYDGRDAAIVASLFLSCLFIWLAIIMETWFNDVDKK